MWATYLIEVKWGLVSDETCESIFSFFACSPPERIFQKRRVSSAAAETIVWPSGDWAM